MLARVLSVLELSAFAPLLGRERTSVKPADLWVVTHFEISVG
jgi:hypothetical protein